MADPWPVAGRPPEDCSGRTAPGGLLRGGLDRAPDFSRVTDYGRRPPLPRRTGLPGSRAMSDVPRPRRRPRRWPYLLGIALFLAYAAWILGPYLRSILIRDAAVTTWSHLATTPIDGTVEFLTPQVNEAVG